MRCDWYAVVMEVSGSSIGRNECCVREPCCIGCFSWYCAKINTRQSNLSKRGLFCITVRMHTSWLGRRPDGHEVARQASDSQVVNAVLACFLLFIKPWDPAHVMVLLIFNSSFYLRELKSINSLVSEPQALSPRWSRVCQIDSPEIGCLGAHVTVNGTQ